MKYTNPLYQPSEDGGEAARAAKYFAEKATEQFREVASATIDVVPYSKFRVSMLPLLAEIANGGELNIDVWLTLVSHPNIEVSVVDDTTGIEMYRVPSVYFNTDVSTDDVDNPGVSVHAKYLEQLRNTSITMAQEQLLEMVESKIDPITNEEMIESGIDAIEKLNTIFAAHDLPLLPNPREVIYGEKPKDAVEVKAVDEDEDFDYDPL